MPNISTTRLLELEKKEKLYEEAYITELLRESCERLAKDILIVLNTIPFNRWPNFAKVAVQRMPDTTRYYFLQRLPKEKE